MAKIKKVRKYQDSGPNVPKTLSEVVITSSAAKPKLSLKDKIFGTKEQREDRKIDRENNRLDRQARREDRRSIRQEKRSCRGGLCGGRALGFVGYKKGGKIKKAKTGAWQRKEGKNPEGGLNAKGVASYRRENPGSKLKTAVTTKPSKLKPGSKSAKRRKSFCARMSGMKKRLTSAKTANDPNSRINKSLRKWNC